MQTRPANTTDLSGQVAIITGAGWGIGRSMALSFAAAGARVLVVDIIPERVEMVTAEVRDAGGLSEPVIADVGDEAAVTAISNIAIRCGRIDVLCNNAGILDQMAMAADMPTALWDQVLRTNLTGPFLMTRAVLPTMLQARRGCIVNTASVARLRAGAGGIADTASKHGLLGVTRSTAWAYANRGIRCNAICPGAIATNILGGQTMDDLDQSGLSRLSPVMGLMGSALGGPEQIASVALFLASESASFVNGAVIPVDMGWSAAWILLVWSDPAMPAASVPGAAW